MDLQSKETSLGSGTDVPQLPPGAREARPLEGAVRSCFDLATRELRGSCDRRGVGDTDRRSCGAGPQH